MTYGAAIEVPEMVLVAVGEPIQAERTLTPRYQTVNINVIYQGDAGSVW